MTKKSEKLASKLITAVEQTADHIMITDKDGRIEYVNRAFERTTGFTENEVIGRSPSILKSGRHDKAYYEGLWQTILSGKVFHSTTTNKKKNGQVYYADQTITPLKNKSGKITHFVSVWKDITERVEHEEKLKKMNGKLEFERKKFETLVLLDERMSSIHEMDQFVNYVINTLCYLLESQRCSFMLLDEKGKKLSIKGAIGLDNQDIMNEQIKVGEGIAGLVAKNKKPMLVEMIDTDKRIKRGNRSGYKTSSFLSVPLKLEDKVLGVINVTDKVSSMGEVYTEFDLEILMLVVRRVAVAIANLHMVKELKDLTITDPMTNLFNRRYFVNALEHEFKRSRRTKVPLSLIMIDIDNFKMHNDKYGHLHGDLILKKIAEIIKNTLREIDISCRYGGDEFVVILPDTDHFQAGKVAEKIFKKIRRNRLKRRFTCSIGVAQWREGETNEEVIEKVDGALYRAKEDGKNRICVESQ